MLQPAYRLAQVLATPSAQWPAPHFRSSRRPTNLSHVPTTIELAACQVFIQTEDYASPDHFERLLVRVGEKLDAARARRDDGAFAHPCLAVFPEMIGAFLPLAGRLHRVRAAKTIDGALLRVALAAPQRIAAAMLRGRTISSGVGFLLSVAPEVRRLYRDAFSRFARRHHCWVVAGSALLPRNAHGDLAEAFEPADGRVYNTSYAFDPAGRHVGAVRKVNLVPTLEDALGLSAGRPGELVPLATPFGRVGTLICYDGFAVAHAPREPGFCPVLGHYDELGCAVVAQPAANFWPWEEPWTFLGKSGALRRREQWLSEGLLANLRERPRRHVRWGVTAQLLGTVFDNRFDGQSHILARGEGGARIVAEARRGDASLAAEEVILRAVTI
jgi:predicted amidohydrolase